LLVDGRILIHTNNTDTDPRGPKTCGYYGSETLLDTIYFMTKKWLLVKIKTFLKLAKKHREPNNTVKLKETPKMCKALCTSSSIFPSFVAQNRKTLRIQINYHTPTYGIEGL
jgi:hypothetical protein